MRIGGENRRLCLPKVGKRSPRDIQMTKYSLLLDFKCLMSIDFLTLDFNASHSQIDWSSIIRSGRFYALGKDVAKANCTDQFKQCYSCKSKDLCWSNQFCQRFEEKEHRVIGSNVKCSSLCIGRCVNSTAAGCFVCRDLSENGICVSSCSLNR